MSSHDVLRANPVWSAWEDERKTLQDKRALLAQHVLDAKRPHEQAVKEHKAAVAAAVEVGEVPPLAPDPPDLRHLEEAQALLRMSEEMHQARKDSVLAEAAGDVEQALRDRESARHARLAMMAPEFRRLLSEAVSDLGLYAQVLGAVDRDKGLSVHPSRQERVPRSISLDGLLDAAEAGVTLLALTPMGDPGGRVLPDDGSDDGVKQIGPRRLGMSSRSFGGDISSWPRVQRLPPGRV